MEDKGKKMKRSIDGKCPYCGSWKVGPAGGFDAGPSSSSTFPEPEKNYICDECKKLFLLKK